MPKDRPTVNIGLIEPDGGALTGRRKLRFGTNVLGKARGGAASRRDDNDDEPSAFDKKQQGKKRGEHAKSGAIGDVGSSGMVFNKGFGQHILRNPLVIAAIVEKAAVRPTDIVIEIGPGTGNLTEKLLMAAKKVIAYEVDPRMVSELHKRFQNSPLRSKLEIVRGNCLDHDFPYFDRCVANVPYAISSALVFKLLEKPTFKCAVLMFQREFALRVCAPPGSELYCRLSVNSQLLARCAHLMKVSKNSFTPPPKVESSVIRLDPKHPPPPVDFAEWDGLVKLLFNRKNKKATSIFRTKTCIESLRQIHESYCKMESETAMTPEVFRDTLAGLLDDPLLEGRARTMTEENIMHLLAHFNAKGIRFA
jgi:18S rRNA (adenine1779-N6/adenine1780-N6)-dimethyltransferase